MAIARDDRVLTDAQGRALAGARVYYCLQPATVPSVAPPSPLATVYSDLAGTPQTQPIITDGFGHVWAYMDDAPLYTVVMYHPLFGANPIYWIDQRIGGSGGSGNTVSAFAGVPQGTIDGVNTVFTMVNGTTPLTTIPTQYEVWLNFPLIVNLGYTVGISGGQVQITYAVPPQPASGSSPADALYAQGVYIL